MLAMKFPSYLMLVGLIVVLVGLLASANNMDQSLVTKELSEYDQVTPRSALSRFFFYNYRPSDRQSMGFKRALDSLTGVTLGKRAVVGYEPLFAHQFNMRQAPRMYDFRWAPIDGYENLAADLI